MKSLRTVTSGARGIGEYEGARSGIREVVAVAEIVAGAAVLVVA